MAAKRHKKGPIVADQAFNYSEAIF